MINFEGWETPPPPRPSRRRLSRLLLGVGGICLVACTALAGFAFARGRSPAPPSPVTTSPPAQSPVTSPAGELTLGACIDPTTSIVPSFAPGIRADLAQAVGSLAPAGPLDTNALHQGQPVTLTQPGINLTIREVGTNSASSALGQYTRVVTIPAIPGLNTSRPAVGTAHYQARLEAWSRGYGEVSAARKTAAAAASAAARSIANLPLAHTWSGISACVSGLLLTAPPGGQHSYLLASDLQENVAPQLGGSFNGAPLVIVQACDSGNLAYCHGLYEHFVAEMRGLHVGQVTVVRAEDAAQAIAEWVRTGGVTP
jgi:hypothetical protein